MSNGKVSKIKDFKYSAPEGYEPVELENILGHELIIQGIVQTEGKFGTFIFVHALDNNTKKNVYFSTGGKVIVRTLQKVMEKNAFPVSGVISRVKNYYDIN